MQQCLGVGVMQKNLAAVANKAAETYAGRNWHNLTLPERELVSVLEDAGFLLKKEVVDGFVGSINPEMKLPRERAFRITNIGLSGVTLNRRYKEVTPAALRTAADTWAAIDAAGSKPDHLTTGFLRLEVLDEKNGETGIADFSLDGKEMYITVPAF